MTPELRMSYAAKAAFRAFSTTQMTARLMPCAEAVMVFLTAPADSPELANAVRDLDRCKIPDAAPQACVDELLRLLRVDPSMGHVLPGMQSWLVARRELMPWIETWDAVELIQQITPRLAKVIDEMKPEAPA